MSVRDRLAVDDEARPLLAVDDIPPDGGWTRFERASGVLFVALVSTLTLDWILIGRFGAGNVKYFHLVALAFMAVYLARPRPARRLAIVMGTYRAFYGSWIVYLTLVSVIEVARAAPYFGAKELIRQTLYSAVSVFTAAFFLDVEGRKVRRVLQWAGVAAVGTVVTGIGTAPLRRGANPLELLSKAFASADPDIIRRLWFLTFRSEGLAHAGANLRHKVFSAVLIGVAVALICRERPRGARSLWRDWLLLAAAVLGGLLVVISLSRSIILCMVAVLALCGLRWLLHIRAATRRLAIAVPIAAVIVALAISPLGTLLWNRFAETNSYHARIAAVWSAVQPPSAEAALLGVEAADVAVPPHNLVLDAWLSAGVFGAVAVGVALFVYLRVWLREVRRYLTGAPGWALSLQQFWVVAVGAIPLIRAVTAARGFYLTDWVCVGIVLGLVEANRRVGARVS